MTAAETVAEWDRLCAIAERIGVTADALDRLAFFNHRVGDAVAFAPCVCAAAQRFLDDDEADKICDEVWASATLARENRRRAQRDVALDYLDSATFGRFVVEEICNPYEELMDDVVVRMKCRTCGLVLERTANRLAQVFRVDCPVCDATNFPYEEEQR